jgi:hypothetical protein
MKKLQGILIVMLLIAVGIAYRYLSDIEKNAPTIPVSAQLAVAKGEKLKPDPVAAAKNKKTFAEMIHKESESISQLNEHPEEVQHRLKELADQVQEDHVVVLKEKALDTSLNGDERFLSVYILGESRLPKAQEILEQIADTPIPHSKESRLTAQEEIIRGQAIESLREPASLRRVLERADNKFLTDRAQRTLSFREGKTTNSPEKQDQEALGKLLEKKTE